MTFKRPSLFQIFAGIFLGLTAGSLLFSIAVPTLILGLFALLGFIFAFVAWG